MRVVAVSPHLDDAVFSAGAALAQLADEGHDVVVVTVFTRSVSDPQGFALACQTDKGLAPDVDYMALRRAEDERACAVLGARAVHLDHPEAPHRGYASAAALFAEVRPDDDVAERIDLTPHLAGADLVLTCAGVGDHIDHLQTLRALQRAQWGQSPLIKWRDQPYGSKLDPGPPGDHPQAARKLDACAAYATQLGFQFGGEEAMRARFGRVREEFDGPLPGRAGVWTSG